MNPYEAPSLLPDDRPADAREIPARARWLVFASLLLSIMIFPGEADLKWLAHKHDDVREFLMVTAACLVVKLTPLSLYFWINGWRGFKAVRMRIAAIGVLVALQLVLDAGALVAWLTRT